LEFDEHVLIEIRVEQAQAFAGNKVKVAATPRSSIPREWPWRAVYAHERANEAMSSANTAVVFWCS
jgi:hypothetical protein